VARLTDSVIECIVILGSFSCEPLATSHPTPCPLPAARGGGEDLLVEHWAEGRVLHQQHIAPRSPMGSGGLGGEGQNKPELQFVSYSGATRCLPSETMPYVALHRLDMLAGCGIGR
jgi:hypothetical protein